jgi:hypothetical protein
MHLDCRLLVYRHFAFDNETHDKGMYAALTTSMFSHKGQRECDHATLGTPIDARERMSETGKEGRYF